MIKQITTGFALMASAIAFSQVGIQTETPQATLDVVGAPADATKLDGIIAPRIEGAQLRAKTYTAAQTGALVYVTLADTAPAGQTQDVTKAGYYYFNGTKWIIAGAGDMVNIYNANGTLTNERIVSMDSNLLKFSGTDGTMTIDNDGESEFYINAINSTAARTRLTSGTADLQIRASSNGSIDFSGQPGGTNSMNIGTPTDASPLSKLEFYTVGSTRMTIDGIGNVGVNTNNPTERFHTNGNVRLQGLPLNGASNAIYTTSGGTASSTQNQTFTATRTLVADANGVLGYVEGLPGTGSGNPGGYLSVGETVSQVYSVPNATATPTTFILNDYVIANGLPQLPIIDGLRMDVRGRDTNYYEPRIYNTTSTTKLVSYQTFATQANENKTSLNNSMAAGNFSAVDNNEIVFWSTSAAEVITTNLQVQIDATTYRWYEFKWWCMEVSGEKKIFLSVARKA